MISDLLYSKTKQKQILKKALRLFQRQHILVPRGRAPLGQHQESQPLARSNDIPVLKGFVNTIHWDQNQSDLSDLTMSMCRVMEMPWIADFRCWTSEVAILGAYQKKRGLWGRTWRPSSDNIRPPPITCNSGQHFAGNSELFPVWRRGDSFPKVARPWYLAGNSFIV